MQALLSGKLGIFPLLLFVLLIVGALLLRRTVGKLRRDLDMAAYEKKRGPVAAPPKPEECLPGYTMLTYQDYAELREQILRELKQEK